MEDGIQVAAEDVKRTAVFQLRTATAFHRAHFGRCERLEQELGNVGPVLQIPSFWFPSRVRCTLK